ncbi:MAG: hypothetical protein WB769_16275 [Pseudolabrys sp.]
MTLDVHTLFLVTIYVEGILGLLLLFVYAQNMALRAVCWWDFTHVTRLASIGLFGLYGSVPDLISIDVTNALLFTAFAMTWTGARVFDGRPVEPVYLITGAVPGVPPAAGDREQRDPVADRRRHHHVLRLVTSGSPPSNSGAGAARRWSLAGRRSSCSSRTVHCSCCARR